MTDGTIEPQSIGRLLADLVQAMSAGHLLSVTAVAVLVGCSASDLIRQAGGDRDRRDAAVDQRVQLHLRKVVAVLSAAERHFGSALLAVQWYRTDGLDRGAQHTPEALTVAGQVDDAVRRLLVTPRGLSPRQP